MTNTALLRGHAKYDWFSLRIDVPGRVINIPTLLRNPGEQSADAADRALVAEGYRRAGSWQADLVGGSRTANIEPLDA